MRLLVICVGSLCRCRLSGWHLVDRHFFFHSVKNVEMFAKQYYMATVLCHAIQEKSHRLVNFYLCFHDCQNVTMCATVWCVCLPYGRVYNTVDGALVFENWRLSTVQESSTRLQLVHRRWGRPKNRRISSKFLCIMTTLTLILTIGPSRCLTWPYRPSLTMFIKKFCTRLEA